jgi:NRAMP (natural resistance-associated macrophage protein)-like metal ion transporter
MTAEAHPMAKVLSPLRFLAVWGPGLLVMLADTDAGNVVTAAQSGALWGYRLLPLLVLLIPLLYMVQELTVRLAIFTGRGHGELIRQQLGLGWACLSGIALAIATGASLITEFTGVAGIGDLYGVPRTLTLPAAAAALLLVVGTGTYRRVERITIIIGLFELAFFAVAWAAHPDAALLEEQTLSPPFTDTGFLYLAAALVGAVFNPWMVFYQQSAVVDKKLQPKDYRAACWDTGLGAMLTQLLTAAVLVAAAALLAKPGTREGLSSVGEISQAMTPMLGVTVGRLVFSAGVLGASMVAAIVSSLALAWGVGEIAGYRRSLEYRPLDAGWFYGVYALAVAGSAALVWAEPDLIWLNVAAQVLNAFLFPVVIGVLVALAIKALPEKQRLRGWYRWVVISAAAAVSLIGLVGGIAGSF